MRKNPSRIKTDGTTYQMLQQNLGESEDITTNITWINCEKWEEIYDLPKLTQESGKRLPLSRVRVWITEVTDVPTRVTRNKIHTFGKRRPLRLCGWRQLTWQECVQVWEWKGLCLGELGTICQFWFGTEDKPGLVGGWQTSRTFANHVDECNRLESTAAPKS